MVCKNMANYLNRKATISKRAQELSTLCDVDVLLILYGPDSPDIPETWCSRPDPATVIDKFYAKKKPNNQVKPKPKKGMSGYDQFLRKLSLDELKDLNSVLAAKIESVNQRINGIKEGKKGYCNSYQTRDLIDCDKTGYILHYNDGLNVEDLGCQENNFAYFSSQFVDDVTEFKLSDGIKEGNKGFSNLSESLDFGFGFDGKTDYIDYNDGLNVDYLRFEGINRAFVDNFVEIELSNPMWTIATDDYDDIKFVGDDLQMINRLVTVEDGASAMEFLCY